MPSIESYSFGRMTIDDILYTKDVVIFPDGSILSPWWRQQSHVLALNDLTDLLAANPDIIVCGTGAMGVMKPAAGLKESLAARNIEFITARSVRAVEIYNELSGKTSVGGCFHLTC